MLFWGFVRVFLSKYISNNWSELSWLLLAKYARNVHMGAYSFIQSTSVCRLGQSAVFLFEYFEEEWHLVVVFFWKYFEWKMYVSSKDPAAEKSDWSFCLYVWICGIFPSHCVDVEINRTIKLNTQTRTTYVCTHKARQLFPFIYFRGKNSPHIYRTKNHNSSKIKSRNGTEWHIFSNDAFK